jgi:large subunit ribosomal protein L10
VQVARVYPEKKVRLVNKLKEYTSKYSTIAVIRLEKVRAEQLMMIRKKFDDQIKILMVKNKIVKRMLVNNIKGIDKLLSALTGQNAFIFTNMSPFKLYLLLDKEKVYLPAKGGDKATEDIVVSAGNTGLPPGPVLSEFREAKIQTKIEGGTVWIAKDTVVAKSGEEISQKLASLLSKLGIKPIKAGISIHIALEDGILYQVQDLRLDIKGTEDELKQAFSEAFNLALNVAYPTKESIEHILKKAYINARTLSITTAYITPDTLNDILIKAEMNSKILYEKLKEKGYQST